VWAWVLFGMNAVTDAAVLANFAVTKRNLLLPTLLFAGMAGIFIVVRVLRRRNLSRVIIVSLLLALTVADLLRFGWKFTPFTPLSYFFPETKTISFLRSQDGPFRIMTLDDRILPPNVAGYYGLESVDGYDPVYLKRYAAIVARSENGGATTDNLTFQRIMTVHNVHSLLLPIFNVRYVLSLHDIEAPYLHKVFEEGETRMYAYTQSLPRAYFVTGVLVGNNDRETLNYLFEDTVESGVSAVVEKPVLISSVPLAESERVRIVAYMPSSLRAEVSAREQRMLVILNQYHEGWKAFVDGTEVAVLRVNYAFQGILISPGMHIVDLQYRWM